MRTADLQDYGVNRDSVLHVVLRYLAVLVNGIPAAEAQMGQAIALLANWEMNAWSADPIHGAPIPFRRASMRGILPRDAPTRRYIGSLSAQPHFVNSVGKRDIERLPSCISSSTPGGVS